MVAIVWLWLLVAFPIRAYALTAKSILFWLRYEWSGSADMGHGPFLPLVSLYVVFLRRKALAGSMGKPDLRGFLFVVLGALLFWMGAQSDAGRLCMAALVFLVWAVPFAVWGGGVARQLVFPAAYLCLCLPIGSMLDAFSMKLRLLAAVVGVAIANGIGIPAERIGTGIHSLAGAGFNLDVAEACSGLRSIFAMIALTAAYAFLTQKTLWRKWALFACAIPVAVIGNVARIVAIVLVAAWFGEKKATGFYHDYSGYIVFVVAILMLMELGYLIARWNQPSRWLSWLVRFKADRPQQVLDPVFGKRDVVLLALTPAVLFVCAVMVQIVPVVRPGTLDFMVDTMPAQIGPWQGSPVWHCHNEQCMRTYTEEELVRQGVAPVPVDSSASRSRELGALLGEMRTRSRCLACGTGALYAGSLGEKKLLPSDTRLLRFLYSKGVRDTISVTLVISGPNRNSLHAPEVCLGLQGYEIREKVRVGIPLSSESEALVNLVVLNPPRGRNGVSRPVEFVYWIFSGERRTTNRWIWKAWTAWDRVFRHEASRWVMVTVSAEQPVATKGRPDELLKFSGELMERLRVSPPR